jgi:hypothetical protein
MAAPSKSSNVAPDGERRISFLLLKSRRLRRRCAEEKEFKM